MKIYTKTGDAGKTSLLGGSRVPKHHLRIESYGTVDELNAHVGMIRSAGVSKEVIDMLLEVQDKLLTIGSNLASEPGKSKVKIPKLTAEDVAWLERQIDHMEEVLPPMRHFVLPGGHMAVATTHVARCVCRRAERKVLHLNEESEVPDTIFVYLNRLSDFLFVLSRKLTKDLGVDETPWTPNKD